MSWRCRREGEVYLYSFFNLGDKWGCVAGLQLQIAQNMLAKFERTECVLIDTRLTEFKVGEH